MLQSNTGWYQLLVFFFPRGSKNNIPVFLTLDHPQSDRSVCHQACCLSNASKQYRLAPIACFFLPAGIQKQHSCFSNVRSPTIWQVSPSPSNSSKQYRLVPITCLFLPAGIQKQHSCFANVRSPTIWQVSLSSSLLPLKCFKAIRAGTNYLFFLSAGIQNQHSCYLYIYLSGVQPTTVYGPLGS